MAALAKTSPALTGPQLDSRRIAAALIDLLIPLAGVALAYAAGLPLTRGLLLVGLGWTLYYFFALESGQGQTLGKRAMKLRVVSADGTPATTEQIAKRTVVRILDGHLVGLIVMLATGDRRLRLGDIVAGTVVTEAERAPGAPVAATAAAASGRPAAKPSLLEQQTAGPSTAKPPFYKRQLSMPSFGRKTPGPGATPAVSVPALTATDSSEPLENGRPADAPGAAAPPEVKPFAPFRRPDPDEPQPAVDFDGVEPSVELDRPGPLVELDHPGLPDEADVPDPIADLGGGEPVVEVDEPDREPELQPHPESLTELEPWAEQEVQALTQTGAADPEVETEPDPDEDPGLTIKPIETVSAIDLVMQDAEEWRPAGD
jgi:uncharacterized RDD family membrane protein YckC